MLMKHIFISPRAMDARLARYRTQEEKERFNRDIVKPFYTSGEDYDWTDAADHLRGLETIMHRLRERATVRLMRAHVRGPVLDLGCGSGLMLRHLPAGSVGIDLNPRNVERARRYAPHMRLERADAEALPFPDHSFQAVVCTEVLEHLVFPERAIAGVLRVLRPGGVFFGSVPRATRLWGVRRFSATCPVEEPFHNEMSRSDLASLLAPFADRSIRLSAWLLHLFFVAHTVAS